MEQPKTEQPLSLEEYEAMWDDLIATKEQLERVKHLAQEALDAQTTVANIAQPHVNRIRTRIRNKADKVILEAVLEAFKQSQQRVALIVEGLNEEEAS